MRAYKHLLISLAAVAAAGLTGCLTSPDSLSSASVPVTESEIQAALSSDSLHPVPPPRAAVCDTLKARLALLDSTAPQFGKLTFAVTHVCAVRPDSGRPPKADSLRPFPPKPPRGDSLVPKPDSLRPMPPKAPKPDSLEGKPEKAEGPEHGLRPLPPPPPAVKPDSTLAPLPPKGNSGKGGSSKGKAPEVEIQTEVDG